MKDGKSKRPGLLSSFIRHLQPQPGKGESKAKSTERPSPGRDPARRGGENDDRKDRDLHEGERKGRLPEGDERDERNRDEGGREEESDDSGDAEGARDEECETAPDRSYQPVRMQRGRTADTDAGRDEDDDSRENGRRSSRPGLSGAQAVQAAKEYLVQLTGREPEAVSGLERSGDGWSVTLEVVEMERVPETTDVMGTFRVQLDGRGELVGCTRVRRYYRNQPVEG
jgi:gas vesicle protein GvpO